MSILRARAVTKEYRSRGNARSAKALKGVDLRLSKGDFAGIIGPSGSGKTTLLKMS